MHQAINMDGCEILPDHSDHFEWVMWSTNVIQNHQQPQMLKNISYLYFLPLWVFSSSKTILLKLLAIWLAFLDEYMRNSNILCIGFNRLTGGETNGPHSHSAQAKRPSWLFQMHILYMIHLT